MSDADHPYFKLQLKFTLDRIIACVASSKSKILVTASLLKHYVAAWAIEDWDDAPVVPLFEYYMSLQEFVALILERFGADKDVDFKEHMENHPVAGVYELDATEVNIIDGLITAIEEWEQFLKTQHNVIVALN